MYYTLIIIKSIGLQLKMSKGWFVTETDGASDISKCFALFRKFNTPFNNINGHESSFFSVCVAECMAPKIVCQLQFNWYRLELISESVKMEKWFGIINYFDLFAVCKGSKDHLLISDCNNHCGLLFLFIFLVILFLSTHFFKQKSTFNFRRINCQLELYVVCIQR